MRFKAYVRWLWVSRLGCGVSGFLGFRDIGPCGKAPRMVVAGYTSIVVYIGALQVVEEGFFFAGMYSGDAYSWKLLGG